MVRKREKISKNRLRSCGRLLRRGDLPAGLGESGLDRRWPLHRSSRARFEQQLVAPGADHAGLDDAGGVERIDRHAGTGSAELQPGGDLIGHRADDAGEGEAAHCPMVTWSPTLQPEPVEQQLHRRRGRNGRRARRSRSASGVVAALDGDRADHGIAELASTARMARKLLRPLGIGAACISTTSPSLPSRSKRRALLGRRRRDR